MPDAIITPGTATVSEVLLELIRTQLVIYQTSESDAVPEHLKRSDLGSPNHHGCTNEEYIFQDAAKGEDKRRCFANLQRISFNTEDRVLSRAIHTRKTTETFNKNATIALATSVQMPTL